MSAPTTAPPGQASDREQILDLVAAYSDAVNRRDYEAYAACWAADAVWDLGEPINGRHEGRDAIVAECSRTVDAMDFFVQMAHGTVIEVDGTSAQARTTLNEIGRMRDPATMPELPGMFILAMYSDDLVKDSGVWVFARRTYRVMYIDTTVPVGRAFPAPFGDGFDVVGAGLARGAGA